MTTPTENELRLIEQGRPALEKFMVRWRQSRSLGIIGVIRSARKAEDSTGINRLNEVAENCRAMRDAATGDPGRYVTLERQLVAAGQRVAELLPFATEQAHKVWRSPASLKAIRGDLRDLKDEVEAELDRIVEVQRAFSRENGLGELEPEAVQGISPAWQAIAEFRNRHLLPLLGTAEATSGDGSVNADWDPATACWILLSCGWRQFDPGKGMLGKIADAISGTGTKPTTSAPDEAVPVPATA
jgi:hypothetical protein